jgi:rfaE bifunctional protein nucleotidyltransferase chain/domain
VTATASALQRRLAIVHTVAHSDQALKRVALLFDAVRRSHAIVYVYGDPGCATVARYLSTESQRRDLPTVKVYRPGADTLQAADLVLALAVDDADDRIGEAFAQAERAGAATVAFAGVDAGLISTRASVGLRLPVVDPALVREGQMALWHDMLGVLVQGPLRQAPHDPPSRPEPDCPSLETVLRLRPMWRDAGRTLVWTNGCFDLIHAGHTAFLEQAHALGDTLVVGLNSDESVCRLKGPERPFLDFHSRAAVLRAMRAVDHVVRLRDDLPSREIGLLRPDVCCKDDTYATLPLPERQVVESYGGRMMLLPRLTGHSTTALATRIRDAVADRG